MSISNTLHYIDVTNKYNNITSMMDINQDLYAKLLCQISGRINEEGTSLMKLYLQAKTLVKVKKLES
jgi:membrane protease subunit (stomatin/prohibitin family)